MVQPSGEGAVRCMKMALSTVGEKIDYINPHATSTPIGDLREIEAIREVFGDACPPISATKSLTGHSLGATGVQEAIYSLLMINNGYLRERQYRDARPGLRRHADSARTQGRRSARLRAVELLRLRRHQRLDRSAACRRMTKSVPALLSGKRGLIMGVANDHSIAWGIAQAAHSQGAELAFTYQGEALGKRVRPLAESLGAKLIVPCDVEDPASVDHVFSELKRAWGGLDFVVHAIAFSDKNELKGRYADTTRENFVRTMLVSCFSFTEIAKRAGNLMKPGGSILTLTFGGSARVMPNYNVMGVAKAALEAVSATSPRFRLERRVNAFAGPRVRWWGHRPHVHVQFPEAPFAAAPPGHHRGCRGRRAFPAVRAVLRSDRRDRLCRRRMQCHSMPIRGLEERRGRGRGQERRRPEGRGIEGPGATRSTDRDSLA
jgi:enoyl-[acyl-carrier-protein] reductase (NADH)